MERVVAEHHAYRGVGGTGVRAAPAGGLSHDAFVYRSAAEFLEATIPFIREGLALDEPVLAVPAGANAALLRRELGELADRVEWAESSERDRPLERLSVVVRYAEDRLARGARRIRLLGEPAWPASPSSPATAEWTRYESYLNVVLARYPLRVLCPYGAHELAERVVADAASTHPTLGGVASAEYVDPDEFARGLDRFPLSEPPGGAVGSAFHSLYEARRHVVERGREAGLPPEAADDLRLAAGEVIANVFRHADGVARVRTWVGGGSFVCEVRDRGPGIDDPFAGYAVPDARRPGGWGLSIARRLCEAVEIRSTAAGTQVRLHVSLG